MSQNSLLNVNNNELEIIEFIIDEKQPDGSSYSGHYGINVAKVLEIIRLPNITSVPSKCDPSVLGTFNLRGKVLPILNLATWLGKTMAEESNAKVIVTEFNGVCTGFLVSGVNRIYRLSWTDVEAPGQFLQNMSRSSVTGVVRLEERVIFLLDLEAIVAELHPAMALRFDAADMAASDGKTYTILHVDDSSSIRSLLLNLLNKEGRFKVEQRVNGQEAWDYLQSVRNRCEAENRPISDFLQGIITDIEMPAMDGLALCKRIKDDPVLKKLPVAIFSSMINESLARKCALVGADAQYTKPDLKALSVKLHELITTVWGHQGQSQSQNQIKDES